MLEVQGSEILDQGVGFVFGVGQKENAVARSAGIQLMI